jgi:glycosyltransferase involved in cell wall biosynthesis
MSAPIISVVMSVYNGARFLHEAIESILEQTFTDFEFIIVDDGSTDETVLILDSYAKRDVRVKVYSHARRGLTESLNRGCMMAVGEYIARMDADDISVRDRFMWQMEFMDAHSEVGLLGGAFELIDTTGKTLCTAINPLEDREIRRALLDGSVFLHPSVLMRKAALDMVGRYRKVMHAEDYDLWLRMAERTRVANLPKVLVKYRVHADQVSVSKCKEQALWTGAAQLAALLRREGKPDPLDSIPEMTPAVLTGLGLTERAQQTNTARGYLRCVRNLYRSGEYTLALDAIEALHSEELENAEKWVIADSYLWAGKLYWREKKIAKCVVSFLRAVVIRPLMLGRPLKPLQQYWQAMLHNRERVL